MPDDSINSVAIHQSAIALVRGWIDNASKWLVIQDAHAEQYRLVEASRIEEESFRESIDREVAWQLELTRGKDYIVSSVPRLHLEIPIEIAHGCSGELEQRVDVVEFYLVELYGQKAKQTLLENTRIKWWSPEEILNETATHGIISRQQQVLRLADILR